MCRRSKRNIRYSTNRQPIRAIGSASILWTSSPQLLAIALYRNDTLTIGFVLKKEIKNI